MENKRLKILVTVSGFLAVALGAFGAHALRPMMDETGISNFTTANRYHFYHTLLGLLLCFRSSNSQKNIWAIRFLLIGILNFSGSLYLLSLRSTMSIPSIIGVLTPIGGLFFLMAWGLIIYEQIKS